MAPKITVKIIIEEENRVFFPSDTVKGTVEVNILKKATINYVRIEAIGLSEVKCTQDTPDPSKLSGKGYKKKFVTKEKYYETNITLYPKGTSAELLSKGIHKFDFSYELPPGIPGSSEGKFGYVRHSCKALVDVDGKDFDLKPYALLSVGSIIDLNILSKQEEIVVRKDKNEMALFGKSDTKKLSLNLTVNRSGFVPGESIIINARCSNLSTRATRKTKLELWQTVVFTRDGRHLKIVKKKICSKKHPGIAPGTDDIWSGVSLAIPPVTPTIFLKCSLIYTFYNLVFTVVSAFPSRSLTVSVEIIIGTIPFKETFETFVPASQGTMNSSSYASSSAYVPAASVLLTKNYPSLPPPAFKAITKKEKKKDSKKNNSDDDDDDDDDDDEDYFDENQTIPTKYLDSKSKIKFTPFTVYYHQKVFKEERRNKNEGDSEVKLEL